MPIGRIRKHLPAILIAALVALPACVDLFTRYLNVAPAYFLPLLLFSRVYEGRRVMRFALLLSAVTLAGYLLGPQSPGMSWHAVIFSFWMVNRLIAVWTFFLIAALARWWVRSRSSMERWGATILRSDEDRKAYHEVMGLYAARFAAAASLLLIPVFALTDLLTPANFNIPIFYCVPVAMSSALRSRPLLWGEATATAALSLFCYKFGMSASGEVLSQPVQYHWILYNRYLAIGALAVMTLVMNFTMPTRWVLRLPTEESLDGQT